MNSLNMFSRVLILTSVLFGLSRCLVTRSQLSDSPNPSARYNVPKTYNPPKAITGPVKTSQEVAALESQLRSYEEQFRTMLGRIEELETKANTASKPDSDRVKDLEQAISEMLVQQEQLKNEIKNSREAQLQAAQKAKEQSVTETSSPSGNLELADKLFAEGKWESAAQEFQEFRKNNPKSNEISIVTYKIGVCFQELGLKNEAKTFFTNVIKNYPSSKASKFAKFRLDNLK